MLSICIFQNYVSEMSPPTSEALPFLGTLLLLLLLLLLFDYAIKARTYSL